MSRSILKYLFPIAVFYIPLIILILNIVGDTSSYNFIQDDTTVLEDSDATKNSVIIGADHHAVVVEQGTTNFGLEPKKTNDGIIAREYDSRAEYREDANLKKNETFTNNRKVIMHTQITTVKKPKLILHVGPRKTATTTIQHFMFWANGGVIKVARELAQDNFFAIHTEWPDVLSLVEDCLLKLPHEKDLSRWHRFTSMFDEAYAKKYNVVVSNEAFSLVRQSEDVRALFLTLTKKWDVCVIIAYRPLEEWYPSMYKEDRKATFRDKGKGAWRYLYSKYPNPCNIPFAEYFTENWKQKYLGDPLETLETFEYIFGKDKVKTLMMTSPNHVDITQQFICDGLGAKKSCAKVKRMHERHRIRSVNKSEKKFMFDHDLLLFGAYQRQMVSRKCERHRTTKKFEVILNELNMTIRDLPQVCISAEQFAELKEQSWITETKMSAFPRSKKEFNESFTQLEKESKLCNVDVGTVLANPRWADIFRRFPCNLL